MELFRRGYNCLQHLVTLIFVVFGWLLEGISRPMSETAAGAGSPSELVIARTVAPTDALDNGSGQVAVGELVTSSSSVPVFPYTASLVNLDVSETRRTGSEQAAAGELVTIGGGGGVPVLPYNGSLVNLDISVTRTTGWATMATEETDHGHVEELVTGHR